MKKRYIILNIILISIFAAVLTLKCASFDVAAASAEPKTFDSSWLYAENSKINSGTAYLYHADEAVANHVVVCVNAGHGTRGGSDVQTLCHPDGTSKVTGGSTAEGETYASAVSYGTTMLDGTPEANVTLQAALVVKERLLSAGYDVLMIRESADVQLDNVARTLMANAYANAHIAIHYDSTSSDKGAFFCGVPNVSRYRNMEPVASHYTEHERLGTNIIEGFREMGIDLFEGGRVEIDLTQTSYATIPSIDLEIGDRASDYSNEALAKVANGIAVGLGRMFSKRDTVSKTKKGVTYQADRSGSAATVVGIKETKTSITIPSTITIDGKKYRVTKIAKRAGEKNTKLKTLVLGKNVKKIAAYAFYKDKKLKTITFLRKKSIVINKAAFRGIKKTAVIYVPLGLMDQYIDALTPDVGFQDTMQIVEQ